MPPSSDAIGDPTLKQVVERLDPVLLPLGFASGQGGVSGTAGQVIYCSAHPSGDGRCADVLLHLRQVEDWQIVNVSYDGFDDDHVEQMCLRGDVMLLEQLKSLRTTIPDDLHQWRR